MNLIYYLTFLFCLIFYSNGYAQISKKELIGKWHITKLTLDTTILFDINNIEYLKQRNLQKLRELKPDYTAQDSLNEINHLEKGIKDIQKVFFQFNEDGTYSNTKIKGGGRMTDEIESGKYILKKKKIILIDHLNRRSEGRTSYKSEYLEITFTFPPRTIKLEFKK